MESKKAGTGWWARGVSHAVTLQVLSADCTGRRRDLSILHFLLIFLLFLRSRCCCTAPRPSAILSTSARHRHLRSAPYLAPGTKLSRMLVRTLGGTRGRLSIVRGWRGLMESPPLPALPLLPWLPARDASLAFRHAPSAACPPAILLMSTSDGPCSIDTPSLFMDSLSSSP
jgi:hypothetical protein